MARDIDPDCAAGIDCEGCNYNVYCPQRDDERKRRQSIAGTLGQTAKRKFTDALNDVRCRADITLKDGSKAQCGRREACDGLQYCWQHQRINNAEETRATSQP